MTCLHNFEFNGIYVVNGVGCCETCGCEHVYDHVHLLYQGDSDNVHLFSVITPFSCIGCHKDVLWHRNYCGGLDVTREMQSLKKDTK